MSAGIKKSPSNGSEKILSCEEQQAKINEVKKLIGTLPDKLSIYCSDASISRYLRARNWNVKKATKMLKDTLKWRSEYKPEEIPWMTPFKCLQREFEDVLNSEEGKDIYINTVDAFQGQERDVIIMSCVRASTHGVGFVADIRRMNVALTRARRALWVMGNASALMQCDDWAALITDAKARNCFMDIETLPKEFRVPRIPSYAQLPGKPSNMRGFRSAGPRHRSVDMHMESRSGTAAEDDEKLGASVVSRNGSYRPMKPPFENSLDDFDQSGDKSRDAWQYGIQKKHGPAGVIGRRDI